MKSHFGIQLSPHGCHPWHLFTMVVKLHLGHYRTSQLIIVAKAPSPVENRHLIFKPRRQGKYVRPRHMNVVVGYLTHLTHVTALVGETKRPASLKVTAKISPTSFLVSYNCRITPSLPLANFLRLPSRWRITQGRTVPV